MGLGRPPIGAGHVDGLEGPEETKERLKVIVETLTGNLTVEAASERLGVSPSRFHELRRQALEGALAGLAPGRAGRPPKGEEPIPREQELAKQVADLKVELQMAYTRTELALAMPHVLMRDRKKKHACGRSPRRRGR